MTQKTDDLQVPQYNKPTINVILRKQQLKSDLVEWYHGCACAPVKSTWLKAIKNGHFHTWPGLDVPLVTKHLTPSIFTAKGHMHQEKGGLQSTTHINSSSILKNIKSNIATLKKTTNQHNEYCSTF